MQPQGALPFKSWYLVYTKPRQEHVALDNLLSQGYGAYLPRVREMRNRNGRSLAMAGPLFPRYLFIHLDSHPTKLTDELVTFLKSQEGQNGVHEFPEQKYATGDKVRVADGVFQGYEGILLARTSRERVLVLLDLLTHQIRMQVSVGHIEATHQ